MSEFCEHVEWNVIGFKPISYERAEKLHRRECSLCAAGANDTTVAATFFHPVRFKCLDCGRKRSLGHTLCRCKSAL